MEKREMVVKLTKQFEKGDTPSLTAQQQAALDQLFKSDGWMVQRYQITKVEVSTPRGGMKPMPTF